MPPPPALPIKPEDTVRTADKMAPPDKTGTEGRWLDVPRLPQFNGTVRSCNWSSRTAAAMIFDYWCASQKKAADYVKHADGAEGVGIDGLKANLRFSDGHLFALDERGDVDPVAALRTKVNPVVEGDLLPLRPGQAIAGDAAAVRRFLDPILSALEKNIPVALYTRLSTAAQTGHVVVVSGWKRDQGLLWLRITDPAPPAAGLLHGRDVQIVEQKPSSFSEYWLRASRLFDPHPEARNARLLTSLDGQRLGRFFFIDQAVADTEPVVHRIATSAPANAAAKAQVAPETGGTSLPFMVSKSLDVTPDALQSLHSKTEGFAQGRFPLGNLGTFHSGAHFPLGNKQELHAFARGEVVAARLATKEQPTSPGFILLRHPLQGGKNLYSLFLHLRPEALAPDRASAAWLRRLLIDLAGAGAPQWRVTAPAPTWLDQDKPGFSPVNVQHLAKDRVEIGVYPEEDRIATDHGVFVKLKGKAGKWVREDPESVLELSSWAKFDLDALIKRLEKDGKNDEARLLKDLRGGKTVVFDKLKQGSQRKTGVEAGETVGCSGKCNGIESVHWSVFSKDPIFPAGTLPAAEFGPKDPLKLQEVELTEEFETPEHTRKLLDALDPKKTFKLARIEENIVTAREIGAFYAKAQECWRGRYLAIKSKAEFALDLTQLVAKPRYKSHSKAERDAFVAETQPLVFWSELQGADEIPADGKVWFVHPVTALKLISQAAAERDATADELEPDPQSLPEKDVLIELRNEKGPVAGAQVTVKLGGAEVLKAPTDAAGELLVPFAKIGGETIEVSVDPAALGKDGEMRAMTNETWAPPTLRPGDAAAAQSTNGQEKVIGSWMGLPMVVAQGKKARSFKEWKDRLFQPAGALAVLPEKTLVTVERILFRRADGSAEFVQAVTPKGPIGIWSVEDGDAKLVPVPPAQAAANPDPQILGAWSHRIAHLTDFPVLAGRVQGVADGTALEISFFAMLSLGSAEHDLLLHVEKSTVEKQGFAVGFDPHLLAADRDLLLCPRPVFATVKAGDKTFSLRDRPVTVHGDAKVLDRPTLPAVRLAGAHDVTAFLEPPGAKSALSIRNGPALTRRVAQLAGGAAERFVADGADQMYVGMCSGEPHLAVGEEQGLPPAEALRRHHARALAAQPDAPGHLFAAAAEAFWRDTGIATALCARDCATGLHALGAAAGCTDAVRTANLASCHLSPLKPCGTAIKASALPLLADPAKCAEEPSACAAVVHDKSHCFAVADPGLTEERERWSISLPASVRPPAKKGAPAVPAPAMRAAVVNPKNGAAVICSLERLIEEQLAGPNGAVPEASLQAGELQKNGHALVCGVSQEALWKLGLAGVGEAAPVLVAFVGAEAPLGPLPEGASIRLTKAAGSAK